MQTEETPLKIAIFTETFLPKIDGIVSILCLMLQRLQEQGHQVILFAPAGAPSEYAGAEVVGVDGPRLPLYPELRINLPRRHIWQRLQAFQPDLIHMVNPVALGPFGLSYARWLKVPTVASFHPDLPRYVEHSVQHAFQREVGAQVLLFEGVLGAALLLGVVGDVPRLQRVPGEGFLVHPRFP